MQGALHHCLALSPNKVAVLALPWWRRSCARGGGLAVAVVEVAVKVEVESGVKTVEVKGMNVMALKL